MKKNFFKKLSFVLAFAMVATTAAPAASASAAAAPNLAKRYTTAYEGKTYSYAVKNAAGYTVKWVVSGKGASYAKLSKKSGAKTVLSVDTKGAAAAKNAPVVVTAKFYKGNKLVKAAGDAVTLKVSATAVDIVTKADVTKFPTGEAVKFSRKITPANATSVTYWSVTDKDGKATTKATIDSKGNLTVTELGDYVVVAEAKNAKNGKVIAKDTQEVTAVLGIEKATQQSVTKLDVVFNTDMKDAKLVDFSIVNDTTKTTAAIKSIKVDGKLVTVETFAELNDAKSYTVKYKDATASFVASDGKVASLTITPATVPATVATEIKVLTKDANGVTLKENPYKDLKDSKLDFSLTLTTGYTDGSKLVLHKVGDTAKASATYHTYDYKDGKEVGAIKTELTITAVDKTAATLKETKLHVGDNGPTSWSNSTLNDKLAIKDSGKKVYLHLVDSNDKELTTGYKLESSNKDVMLLSDSGNLTVGSPVTAVAEGTAYVLVKDRDDKVILSLPVAIVAERKAHNIKVGTNYVELSAVDAALDTKEVSVDILDQYGDKMPNEVTAGKISVTCTSAPSGVDKGVVAGAAYATKANGKVTFNGAPFVTAGTYYYSIKAADYTAPVTVVINTPSGDGVDYRLIIDNDDVDLKVDKDSTSKDVKIKVAILQGGAIIGYLPLDGYTAGTATDGNGLDDMIEIKKGSDAVTGSTIVTSATGSTIVFNVLSVAGTQANKLKDTGSYSIELKVNKQQITNVNTSDFADDGTDTITLTGGFSIKDTQSPLTADRKEDKVDINTSDTDLNQAKAAAVKAFKFFYEGNELKNLSVSRITDVDFTKNGNEIYIKSVKVNVWVDNALWVPLKVETNKTVVVE